jgi:multisubunit Na+/H+ antiporter MnhC subunit
MHRTGLLAIQTFLWIVVTWLGYATWDGLVHLHSDSAPYLVKFDLIVTAIFVGFATFLLFLIGTVRGKLAPQKDGTFNT